MATFDLLNVASLVILPKFALGRTFGLTLISETLDDFSSRHRIVLTILKDWIQVIGVNVVRVVRWRIGQGQLYRPVLVFTFKRHSESPNFLSGTRLHMLHLEQR